MAKKSQELSVFFPCYNEEENVENTVSDAEKVLKEHVENYEIIIVNDGSTDRTGEIADQLAAQNDRIRVVHHSPNRGYGGAVKSGLHASKYKWITFTDADGQFDFSELTKLLDLSNKADLVIGYRVNRADPFIRKLNAKMWGLLIRLLFGLNVKDIDCAFKLIKKEVIDNIILQSDGALVSAELLIKAEKKGYKIIEVGVHHYPRAAGEQTGANIKVILKAFRDLFALWKVLRA